MKIDEFQDGFRFSTFSESFDDRMIFIDIKSLDNELQDYLENIKNYILKNRIKNIFVLSYVNYPIDLLILKDLVEIEDLTLSLSGKFSNYEFLYNLKLKSYSTPGWIDNNMPKLSLEKFKNLKELSVYKLSEMENFDKKNLIKLVVSQYEKGDYKLINTLTSLKYLFLGNYSEECLLFNNLIDNLIDLSTLTITQSTIKTLQNIENFKNLEKLELNYCSKINNFTSLCKLKKLKLIEFQNIKSSNFYFLKSLNNLEKTSLINCGKIDSLKNILPMKKLKYFNFVDTIVEDGDLSLCMLLDFAHTFNKRHYNIKNKNLPKKLI